MNQVTSNWLVSFKSKYIEYRYIYTNFINIKMLVVVIVNADYNVCDDNDPYEYKYVWQSY